MFNLLDENWIPVLWANGKCSRVGIKQALIEAHKIRQIAASNPMDRVATIRFLLALIYWCRGNPTDDITTQQFPSEWFHKLDENREYFELFGEDRRFYQRHLEEPSKDDDKEHEVISLIHEIPNGDDKWHFRHSTDKVNGLCQSCCALGLLRLPMFTSGEGRGWHQGINGTPPLFVLPIGRTLFHTLCMNWVSWKQHGEATWVNPEVRPILGQVVPLLTGLTLLPRRIWLHYPAEKAGVCIGCGLRNTHIITTCEYQSSGPLKNELWNDPHVLYIDKNKDKPRGSILAADLIKGGDFRKRTSAFNNKPEYIKTKADGFRMDRPWPDLVIRLIDTGFFNFHQKPVVLFVIGFTTNKAKNVDVWERTIFMPASSSMQKSTLSSILKWKEEGFKLPRDFYYNSEKQNSRKHIEFASTVALIRPQVENNISKKLSDMLAGGDEAWDKAAEEYSPMLEAVAKSLAPGFTVAALEKRKQIIETRPDMTQKHPLSVPAKRSPRKAGKK
jgi:hypothetical protein